MALLKRRRSRIVSVSLVIAFMIGSIAFVHSISSGPQVASTAMSFNPPKDTEITVDTTLMGDMLTNNLTVEANAVLTTNGYQIFCNGTFINYGTVIAGPSITGNYLESYGGSGGGGWQKGNSTLSNTSGYSTRAAGGLGSDSANGRGVSGHSVLLPSVNSSLIYRWYRGGFENFTAGAAGQSAGGISGGEGSYGLYIQARSIINNGLITTAGSSGRATPQGVGFSGGGGGGLILMAYSSQLRVGTTNVQGGAGAFINGVTGQSGSGGSGQVVTIQYSSVPPVNLTDVPPLVLPDFAFVGAYVNYTVAMSAGHIYSKSSLNMSIVSVNRSNQTFTFRENTPKYLSAADKGKTLDLTVSFTGPIIFPVVSGKELSDISRGIFPPDLVGGRAKGNISSGVMLHLPAGTFKTYQLELNQSGQLNDIWIDEQTGLVVMEKTNENNQNLTTELAATNILTPSPKGDMYILYEFGVIASVVSTAVIVSLVIRARRDEERVERAYMKRFEPGDDTAAMSRERELKEMLDRGIIDKDFYDESVSRFKKKDE